MKTIDAWHFIHSIGVNGTSPAAMNATGVKVARIPAWSGETDAMATLDALLANVSGFKCIVQVTADVNQSTTWDSQQQQDFLNIMATSEVMLGIEGPSNLDTGSVFSIDATNNRSATAFSSDLYRDWATGIFNFVKSSSSFQPGPYITGKAIYLIAPSLSSSSSDAKAGNVNSFVDYGQTQAQPVQSPWYKGVAGDLTDLYFADQTYNTPSKPVIATMVGRQTNMTSGSDWITETAQAKMLLNAWLGYIALGSPLMIVDSLEDLYQYSTGVAGKGICHKLPALSSTDSGSQTKVVGRALKTILSLADDHAPYRGIYPTITVTGLINTSDLTGGTLMVGKEDGTFLIFIWNESKVITGAGGADTTPMDNFVNVDFGDTYNWAIIDPLHTSTSVNNRTRQSVIDSIAQIGVIPIASGTGRYISGKTLNIQGYPKIVILAPKPPTVVPDAVPNFRVTNVTGRTISLAWDAAGNQPSDYEVLYTRVSDGHDDGKSGITDLFFTIQDLNPGEEYKVSILAENDVGQGSTSDVIDITTSLIQPEAANYNPVTTVGPGLIGYDGVTYTISPNHKVAADGVEDQTTSSVTELYYLNHIIFYEGEDGFWYKKKYLSDAWATSTDPRGVQIPPAPTGLAASHITSQFVTLAWDPVPDAISYFVDENHYMDVWRSDGLSPDYYQFYTVITPTLRQTGFATGTRRFRVRATTLAGDGAFCTPISVTFAAEIFDAPDQVTGLAASGSVHPFQQTISWTAPGNNPEQYYVLWRLSGTVYWNEVPDFITATSVTITHLEQMASYDYMVIAVNAIGTGTPSDVVSITTGSTGGGGTRMKIGKNGNLRTRGGRLLLT